jgi:FixJ family two-component response regulator
VSVTTGYRSAGFRSTEAFIESGSVENACCLILDIKLPGMSGFALQEVLTASHTAIPVIVITGHDRQGMEEQALRLGAVAYLRKPFDKQAILDAVHHICRKQVMRQCHNRATTRQEAGLGRHQHEERLGTAFYFRRRE